MFEFRLKHRIVPRHLVGRAQFLPSAVINVSGTNTPP